MRTQAGWRSLRFLQKGQLQLKSVAFFGGALIFLFAFCGRRKRELVTSESSHLCGRTPLGGFRE